ncbi:hypothetical protein AgCh_035469 [Apium graveolens]
MQKMNDSKTIKEYTGKLLSVANKLRLFDSDFFDSRIIQKIRVTLPERFDATISSLENTKDLSTITLAEINNSLQAQEQRRLKREEGSMEGALQTQLHINCGEKDRKKKFQKRPDVKGEKCNKMGHDEKICKGEYFHKENAHIANEHEEEQLFVASCFASSSSSSDCWLIDSGCTNHMTGDEELFRELD